MAVSCSLEGMEDFVRSKVVGEQWTHLQLSCHLQSLYPGVRGFSVRSIQRFCASKDIHRTSQLDRHEVEQAVTEAVMKVIFIFILFIIHNYRLVLHMEERQ